MGESCSDPFPDYFDFIEKMDQERFSWKKFIFLTVETLEVVKVGFNNMDFQLNIECSFNT